VSARRTTGAFQQRLRRCVERGNLTVSDLARWFDRPYATVRSWLAAGREPSGGPVTVRRAYERLAALEQVVRDQSLRDLPMRQRAERLVRIGTR
jgi:transposase-like protein